MSDHREALERVIELCGQSRAYSRRTQLINDVAMKAVGMTAGQRHARHVSIMERIGDNPGLAAYLGRREKRRAYIAEASKQHGFALPDDFADDPLLVAPPSAARNQTNTKD